MSAPAPLSAADLQVLASSVLERVELVAMTVELGGAPPERTIASVVASALELHRELARTLDGSSAQEDGDLLARISGTMERLNDALAIVAALGDGDPFGRRAADGRLPAGSRRAPSVTGAR